MLCRSLKGHCVHIVKTYTIFQRGSFNHLDLTAMFGLNDDEPNQTAFMLESFNEGLLCCLPSIICSVISFEDH